MKDEIRKTLLEKRNNLSEIRRRVAENEALLRLKKKFQKAESILSYASFGSEFNMWELNRWILGNKRFCLPRVEGFSLKIYEVTNLAQLKISSWGICEPDPNLCKEMDLGKVDAILVPALGFDKNNHRLGYGKGYYDRFFSSFKTKQNWIGIGFKEQFVESLPVLPTDVALKETLLF